MLNAFDISAPTNGIFLAETDEDLQIDTVISLGDVSLYTIDGDINDARANGNGDDEVNILGQTIDLDANDYEASPDASSGPNVNAHIGESDNDVEIDSSRGATSDVSLEADGSIYVTGADSTTYPELTPDSRLRLVLARAWNAFRGGIEP